MKEGMDFRTVIRRRVSIRHYEARPVPEEILQAVMLSGEKSVPIDASIEVCFHLVREGKTVAERMTFMTGARLLFGSAPHFIIATSEEKPLFMLNMGFRMEQMILYATQIGLGTCWIGAMFNEERISPLINLGKSRRVVALTPIGYPDISLYGRIASEAIELGSVNFGRRRPLGKIAFGPQWGSSLQTEDAVLLEALECARLAPSLANTQPWRFLITENEVIAIANTRPKYGNVREGKQYYYHDVGIAMSHFFLAAREMGWVGEWHTAGFDPGEVAAERAIPDEYEAVAIYRR